MEIVLPLDGVVSPLRFLPPVSEKGQLLVDGGYLAVLPIEAAAARAAGLGAPAHSARVIAVDVSSAATPAPTWEWGPELSGWRVCCCSAGAAR